MNVQSVQYQTIERFIEDKIMPGILSHGGELKIVDLENNVLTLEIAGACGSCSVQAYTTESISNYLLDEFPDLDDVVVKDSSSDMAPE
jgi:Fe-S cluster biogenesis protein NfuA